MKHMGVAIFLLASLAVGVCIGLGVKQWMHKPASVPETPGATAPAGALPKFRGFTVHLTGAGADTYAGTFEAMVNVHATAVLLIADVEHDKSLAAVVKEAQSRKLQVFLAQETGKKDRTPATATYLEQMKALAAAAKSVNAYGVCVGLGVDVSIGDDDYWKGLFKTLRGIAPKARYAFVCGPEEYPMIGWWDDVDIIGVGDGFALPPREHAELDDLRNAWRKHLDELCSFASRLGRPAMLIDVPINGKAKTSQRIRHAQAMLLEGRDRPELGGMILQGWPAAGSKDGFAGVVESCWATPSATDTAAGTLP